MSPKTKQKGLIPEDTKADTIAEESSTVQQEKDTTRERGVRAAGEAETGYGLMWLRTCSDLNCTSEIRQHTQKNSLFSTGNKSKVQLRHLCSTESGSEKAMWIQH